MKTGHKLTLLKPWQLVALVFVLPVILSAVSMMLTFFWIVQKGGGEAANTGFAALVLINGLLCWLSFLCFAIWLWQVNLIFSKLPGNRSGRGWFLLKLCLLYVSFYIPLFIIRSSLSVIHAGPVGSNSFPFHFIAFLCLIYAMHTVAKTIAAYEQNQLGGSEHYRNNLLQLWFFPIGLYRIQSKIPENTILVEDLMSKFDFDASIEVPNTKVKEDITVLIVSLSGSGDLFRELSPDRVVEFTNEYLTLATHIIQKHGGLLDKYAGCGIYALWNCVLKCENGAQAACQAAIEIRESASKLIADSGDQFRRLSPAIGIALGRGAAGNIGSQQRFNYTVMGPVMSRCECLERHAHECRGRILVNREIVEQVSSEIEFRQFGKLDYCENGLEAWEIV